jgi:hypothetical protein
MLPPIGEGVADANGQGVADMGKELHTNADGEGVARSRFARPVARQHFSILFRRDFFMFSFLSCLFLYKTKTNNKHIMLQFFKP